MRIRKQHFVVGSLGLLAGVALVSGTLPEARLSRIPEAHHAAAQNDVREEQKDRVQNVEVTQKKRSQVSERCQGMEGAQYAKCVFKTSGWRK